ncbi:MULTISPECIES: HNH endonuclease [Pseudomonas fluorescens group]|uniref:HNH endonuclease n=1 Tax=Pseudomonas fluorescens TaxID=294 RepID=A0AAE2U631_PSEFL|nr:MULTISPECIES: HNH endonuclease [Pseudomonas fluorescens group]MBA1427176.1 hypothetical protein [Pseudomonas orientalis]MBD8272600.1 HNH endonuclease [Pseudomonas fluorescens]
MHSLANTQERAIIKEILKLVTENKISSTEGWKLFSNAKQTDVLTAAGFVLSEQGAQWLKDLKVKVISNLKRKSKNRCAYCRRPMGTHAMSWHIEHIKPKAKFFDLMFSLQNLVYACLDCNFTKNNNIDNKKKYIFDIINPGARDFSYSSHLAYYQLTTENLHLIKYAPISIQGKNTYSKLSLYKIEALEMVTGLNSDVRDIAQRIDAAAELLEQNLHAKDLAEFLTRLKLELSIPKN